MATIGVLLSGCGKNDGSEIHEAALTLLFLDRAGATVMCMAPDIDQHDVINHLKIREFFSNSVKFRGMCIYSNEDTC